MILITEAIEKRSILLDRYQDSSPETTSGIYSRSFFWWLNKLMTTGYGRVIQNEDLYPIDDVMKSAFLQDQGQRVWSNAPRNQPRALFWSTLKASRTSLAYCVFPRLCLVGFRYAQPFLLSRTVDFANSPDEPDSIGWGLTGAFGLVFLGMAVVNGSYEHMTYRFVTMVRGTLVSMIYAKTVDLSITALDESAAVTLMASDSAFATIHEVWAVPIELGIALYLLQRQLGLSFLAPAFVAFGSTAAILGLSRYIGHAQKIWIEGIQTRVDSTASMLGSMKGLRVNELRLSTQFRKLLLIRVFLGAFSKFLKAFEESLTSFAANSTTALAPLVTFIVFVLIAKYTGRTLDTSAAFTGLSLISLLANPMNNMIRTIPMLNAAMACFARIQIFLNSDARQDHRLPLNPSSALKEDPSPNETSQGIEMKVIDPDVTKVSSNPVILDVQNASFAWTVGGEPVVRDVTFTLPRHQFCFIIGPVGSGFVYSSFPSTAYVDQTPWIQNGTIQQNILGISAFDDPWYRQVVRACALEQDISMMPKGHATPVGSAGISLSGGQKQRLALARAVYARKELVILDDIFSGLDAETEEQVFTRLLGKQGLFQQMKVTVLLVTHAVHRLPYSNHVIALDAMGRIAEQGSFAILNDSGGYVQGLAAKLKGEDNSSSEEGEVDPLPLIKLVPTFPIDQEEYNAQTEELNRQTGDFQVYKYYFASIGWKMNLTFIGFVVLYGTAGKLTEFIVTFWTDAVATQGNAANSFYLGIYSLLAGLGLVGLMGGAYWFMLKVVPKTASVLHERLLRTVMAAPLSFSTSTDIGTTTNRQDMTVLDTELPYSLIDLLLSIATSVMAAVLMCLSAGYFAATLPPVILAVWVLQKYYLRTSRQIRLLDLEAKSPLYSHFIESLSGLVTIRSFGWESNFQELNLALLDVSQKPYYLLLCIQRWLSLILDLIVATLAVILMVLVVKLRTDISPGYVGLALLNVMSFNELLATIIKNWTQLETSFGAIARLKSFSATTANENLPGENALVPDNWPSQGAIEFKNVSASYTDGGDLVVKNLSLSVAAGEKVGICGRSGSGKSSLITTLFRMLELTPESSITIDGIDITKLPRQLVRSCLNAIPQEPFFIKGTIRSNADPYRIHTDAAIIAAIQKVQLWPLVNSKGGLDAELEQEFFSHGQRQFFCLARAILRKSKVVVLDEVTSSVDSRSDELMQRVIRDEFGDSTIICVAHRLDTILDFGRIALLGGGELKELDSPEALLGRDSLFKELYNS
ncbi:abc multidrug transporter B [Hyphodiscus hymeniophilus]|uniref:Abc multidrug transporter B n=1 Tax=Hyphodiscus hymeniophilus TaxID=353542 RepID=A0A9P7AUI0_9HELO|nr:abc multidrug transporter B [Hyphodiscus hymeniophilus]